MKVILFLASFYGVAPIGSACEYFKKYWAYENFNENLPHFIACDLLYFFVKPFKEQNSENSEAKISFCSEKIAEEPQKFSGKT